MQLDAIPIILGHTMRWCYLRALRRKYKQVDGAPQGMQSCVGLVQLLGNKKEHEFYRAYPETKGKLCRARFIDDTLV